MDSEIILPIKECENQEKYKSPSYLHEYFSNLGSEYKKKENYTMMKKYFILSHNLGNKHAISKLGLYYHTIEKNFYKAIKCYLIGEKNNSIMALQNLSFYYNSIGKLDLALKYNLKVKNNPDYYIIINKKNKNKNKIF
jgi:hypothetical protein